MSEHSLIDKTNKSAGDCLPERIKPCLCVALCLCRLTGDEVHCRISYRAHDCRCECRRLVPHRTAGRALAHHVVELTECVPDKLLGLFGDAVGHRQLPHRSPLQGMCRSPTDVAIPELATAVTETPAGPVAGSDRVPHATLAI